MLKFKHLIFFKPKKWKKAGILTKVARKIQLCSIFCNLVSRCSFILTKIWFSIEFKWF